MGNKFRPIILRLAYLIATVHTDDVLHNNLHFRYSYYFNSLNYRCVLFTNVFAQRKLNWVQTRWKLSPKG